MLAKELDCPPPRIGGSLGVVDLWPLVVKESMIRARINLYFDLLAEIFYLTL